MKKVSYLIYLWLVCCLGLQAQSRREMGGIYYAYPITDDAGTDASEVKVPAGFSPYYISHYGRHGSRWMSRDERYLWIEKQFADDGNLTSLGLQIKGIVKRICENAKGNGGKLTRLGELQHQAIARRMYAHYPQIFAAGHQVKARSSVSDRCAKSMLAFTSQLRSLQPQLHLDVKTDSADMAWIAYESPELKTLKKRTRVKAQVSPHRFLQQLFNNTAKIDDPLKLMTEMYGLTSSLQDVGLNFPAYPQEMEDSLNALFTDAEFRAIYEANNLRMNINNGSMATNEEIPARSAISLWQNIETEADAALRSSKSSATLRFGHDTALYRLLSLLFDATLPPAGAREDADQVVLGAETDRMDRVVPMGANLQMIFYKNRKDSVVMKFMLNERDIMLSPVGQVIYGTHYYSWKEWKQEMHQRIHSWNMCASSMPSKRWEERDRRFLPYWFRTARTSGLPKPGIPSSLVWRLIMIRIRSCRDSGAAIGREVARNGITALSPWLPWEANSVCSPLSVPPLSVIRTRYHIPITMVSS